MRQTICASRATLITSANRTVEERMNNLFESRFASAFVAYSTRLSI
jgi:hypothetical protein